MSDVTITWNQSAVRTVIGGAAQKAARKAAKRTAERAESNVYAMGRVRTGRMARGWRVQDVGASSPLAPGCLVWNEMPYTRWQNDGTRYITPGWFLQDAVRSLSAADFL